MAAHVLVVDSQHSTRTYLGKLLRQAGHNATLAATVPQALAALHEFQPDLVIAEWHGGQAGGLEALQRIKRSCPRAALLVTATQGDGGIATELAQLGASVVNKPLREEQLLPLVQRHLARPAAESVRVHASNGELVLGRVARSAAMRAVYRLVDQVARTRTAVLIRGERGVGRAQIAREVHQQGARAAGPFVHVDCGSIPSDLIEGELFGDVRDEVARTPHSPEGAFKLASGGTLFLEGVGELQPMIQTRLAQATQEQRIRPAGSSTYIEVDVRLVSATSRDLKEAVRSGKFNEALYYRLNVVQIDVPPLRERREDIHLLADQFLARHAAPGRATIIDHQSCCSSRRRAATGSSPAREEGLGDIDGPARRTCARAAELLRPAPR